MINRTLSNYANSIRSFANAKFFSKPVWLGARPSVALAIALAFVTAVLFPFPLTENGEILPRELVPAKASANAVYYNFSGGAPLSFTVTAANANQISTNDVWTNVPSVEGYMGNGLTNTHGINPQTVLGTEFANNQLPTSNTTQVNANKGNPSAYNAGGVAEFDSGTYLAIGFQGNVQANPYLVFYLDTTGQTGINFSYDLTDIDGGNNNSVSPIALQYRIGETGNFTNIPEGYVADVTDGPNLVGRVTQKTVLLPSVCNNQPKVQVRLIATNAAASDGTSTPDEWIGINNVSASLIAPTAAHVSVGGRVFSPDARPLANATVLMYDSLGNIRTARTGTFGYYRFTDVPVGENYVFEVRSKRYTFSQAIQIVNVLEETDSINFYADPIEMVLFKSALSRKTLQSPNTK